MIFAVRIRIRRLRWLRLYGEPGVWNDPAKRDAMLRARLACHEAEAQWGRAVRDCGAAHRTARNHRNRDNRGR